MGGRQRGDSIKYAVNPHSRNPNDPANTDGYLEFLLDPAEEGKDLEQLFEKVDTV